MRILAISGSLRSGSHNTALLRAAARLAPPGVDVELLTGLELLPPYNQDLDDENPPAPVQQLRGRIADADALLISTPEYNGTMPGHLKQLVDWASRPYGPEAALYGKPVAVIGASISDYGALWAQDHLRRALGIAGARVLGRELALGAAPTKLDQSGSLTDPELERALGQVVRSLAEELVVTGAAQ
jgi:chromate reductase